MKIMDISHLTDAGVYNWDKDYLIKVLTTGKNAVLHNPKLIAAFQKIDRKDFLPTELKPKAYVDEDLDLGYGEKATRPTTIAQMAELIDPEPGKKYLDIGTGTGFFAMILAYVAGEAGTIFTIERIQWLWEMARQSATKYKEMRNIKFLYRDGLEGLPNQGPFDGIHIGFALQEIPDELKNQLDMKEGKLVVPTTNHDVRVITRRGMSDFEEEIIPGFVFQEGKVGVS